MSAAGRLSLRTVAVRSISDTADLEGKSESEAEEDRPLLGEEAEGYRTRWREIQSTFVDEPREAVQSADALVAEVMQALAKP
jgi:hypothetical protein